MEHIRQFDWCASQVDVNFVNEEDLNKHSVVEKILRNKFYDPLISSEDEGDHQVKFNWDMIFKNVTKNNNNMYNAFVPGMRRFTHFPKLSALTKDQHYECLKVLCAENPHVFPEIVIPQPTKRDFRIFEEVKELYLKEQEEYIKWAETYWVNKHCIRALRPKPGVEAVYEAEFQMKAAELSSFPKTYDIAAQIPMEALKGHFEMICDKDLINVDVNQLPHVNYPKIKNHTSIIKCCPAPVPCEKHPCRFVLPSEKLPTILPTTEVHKALGQWAAERGAQHVCSEAALKCLMERDKYWMLPVTVCQVIGNDGENRNVVVLGSEFTEQRASPMARTYKAFNHLLHQALISPSEKWKLFQLDSQNVSVDLDEDSQNDAFGEVDESTDDEDNLFIVDDDMEDNNEYMGSDKDEPETSNEGVNSETQPKKPNIKISPSKHTDYKCTCKETMFERPLPRSYRRWRITNKFDKISYNVIVHCSHKARDEEGEVILEPIVEYQLDLGATKQTKDKLRSLALSYMLRKNASVVNVRIEGPTGELVTFERISKATKQYYENLTGEIANSIHTTLNHLQGLLPGHYLLQHEERHGANAILYARCVGGAGREGGALALRFADK